MTSARVLSLENVVAHFRGVVAGTTIRAVDDVSIYLDAGEIVGLVGESGCGKSTLGRSIVGLETPQKGRIVLDGTDMASLRGKALRERRRAVQYVFQDPYSSLGEYQTIGEILSEALEIAGVNEETDRSDRMSSLLDQVGLPKSFSGRYARELSGGQRQRVAIARALAVNPRVLICDEPVSALDLSIRAQVMNLLFDLQREMNLACLFIAHDLPLVRQASSRVYVMYMGQIVEQGTSQEIYSNPRHPYTRALLASAPNPDPSARELQAATSLIYGDIPSPTNPPPGCRFHTRCPLAIPECATRVPAAVEITSSHRASCIFALQ